MNGTTEVAREITNTSKNWKATFENLAKYNSNGNEINYTVKEEETNENDLKFYTEGTVTGTKTEGFTITNTFNVPDERIQLTATKTWNDNNVNRLGSIVLVVTGNGQEYTKTITSANKQATNANNWEWTFTNLPKYDSNGDEITYTLSERGVNTGDLNRYIQRADGYTLTNTLIVKESRVEKTGTERITSLGDKVEYQVKYKATVDENYTGSVQVKVVDQLPYEIDTDKEYNLDGGVYNASNKTITWTGTEKEITKNISLVYKNIDISQTTMTNNVKGSIELENGYKEEKTAQFDTTVDFTKTITATKAWKGDSKDNGGGSITISNTRPENVTVQLNKKEENGALTPIEEETLSLSNSWTATWSGKPKYDETTRKEIEYVVTETNVPNKYYCTITKDGDNFTVTNSKYGRITITKADGDDTSTKLPGAEFKLEKLKEVGGEKQVDNTFVARTGTTGEKGTATEGQVKFENLEYGTYRITEIKAPQGYNLLAAPQEIEITENNIDYAGELSNRSVTSLPDTGSIGRYGLIVLGIAILLFVIGMRRKRQEEKSQKRY